MTHLQNTVYLIYRLVQGDCPLALTLRPLVHFRYHDAPVSVPHPGPYRLTASEGRYELSAENVLPPLRMTIHGGDATFTLDASSVSDVLYQVEEHRGAVAGLQAAAGRMLENSAPIAAAISAATFHPP